MNNEKEIEKVKKEINQRFIQDETDKELINAYIDKVYILGKLDGIEELSRKF